MKRQPSETTGLDVGAPKFLKGLVLKTQSRGRLVKLRTINLELIPWSHVYLCFLFCHMFNIIEHNKMMSSKCFVTPFGCFEKTLMSCSGLNDFYSDARWIICWRVWQWVVDIGHSPDEGTPVGWRSFPKVGSRHHDNSMATFQHRCSNIVRDQVNRPIMESLAEAYCDRILDSGLNVDCSGECFFTSFTFYI